MPIDFSLLERLKQNDSTLTELDLSQKNLTDHDIKILTDALAQNTQLTQLNLFNNHITSEGAKALAKNTLLTDLDLGHNRVDDRGAKILASNTSITKLHLDNNCITDEGAKVLGQNSHLIYLNLCNTRYISDKALQAIMQGMSAIKLNLAGNLISVGCAKMVEQAIEQNHMQVVKRRDQFIQSMVTLGRDTANPNSQSYWSKLPKDLMLYIITFIEFYPHESIGKTKKQVYQCVEFIFTHIHELNESLTESVKTQKEFKIVDKIVKGNYQFRFFPSKVQEESKSDTQKSHFSNKTCLLM